MQRLEEIAFVLAGFSLVASFLAAFLIAFPLLVHKPTELAFPPANSLAESIQEAKDLERLRLVCLNLAQNIDKGRQISMVGTNHLNAILERGAIFMLAIGLVYTGMLGYMYIRLKRFRGRRNVGVGENAS